MAEKEYIEREAAKGCVKEHYDDAIIIALDKIPAADVRPVVRGKWKHDGFNWFCNRCNYNALCDKDTGEEVLSPRCPNCGADMDGGVNDGRD